MSLKVYPPRGEFDETMDEISGFGGSYEGGCRAMLKAGVAWIDEHPTADPKYQGFKNIYGVILEDNDDAKALSKAVVDGANAYDPNGGVTGAMHQAVVSHVLIIKAKGWEHYVDEMRKRDKEG